MWNADTGALEKQVGSTKSVSGHSLGAAGVHEAIYSLLMLDRGYPAVWKT